jgi:hypothetical protein
MPADGSSWIPYSVPNRQEPTAKRITTFRQFPDGFVTLSRFERLEDYVSHKGKPARAQAVVGVTAI